MANALKGRTWLLDTSNNTVTTDPVKIGNIYSNAAATIKDGDGNAIWVSPSGGRESHGLGLWLPKGFATGTITYVEVVLE
jgi:hypothetical protein